MDKWEDQQQSVSPYFVTPYSHCDENNELVLMSDITSLRMQANLKYVSLEKKSFNKILISPNII